MGLSLEQSVNIKELKEKINSLPDDMEVMVSRDSEERGTTPHIAQMTVVDLNDYILIDDDGNEFTDIGKAEEKFPLPPGGSTHDFRLVFLFTYAG